MKYKVIIQPEAEEDLVNAFSWYEDKRSGLGYDFLLHIEAGLNFIEKSPEIHSVGHKGTRMHLVKRFPYKSLYLLENETVRVLAVFHGKRDPDRIKKRINGVMDRFSAE
jgi:toxin ParE1/3/4